MNPPARVVVIDGQVRRRHELISLLERGGDIVVAGQGGAATAVSLLINARPDLALVDLTSSSKALSWIRMAMAGNADIPPILALADPSTTTPVDGVTEVLQQPLRWDESSISQLRRCVQRLSLGRERTNQHTVLRANQRTNLRTSQRMDQAKGGDHSPPPNLPREGGGESGPSRPRTPMTSRRHKSWTVIGLAASTGGPPALAEVLGGLAGLEAPILVVQHLRPEFIDGLVTWMRAASPLPVELAVDGGALAAGTVYLAPPRFHLRMENRRLRLTQEPSSIHRPSADVLFESLALEAGEGSIGVLLTGMGSDGAAGLLAIRRAGGHTVAQDEATSAVFGMPRAAFRLGAVEQMLPLNDIAPAILHTLGSKAG